MKSTELIFRITPATEASEAQLLGADLASRFPRLLLLRLDSIIGSFLHFFFFCQSFKNFSGFLCFHCFFLSSSSSLLFIFTASLSSSVLLGLLTAAGCLAGIVLLPPTITTLLTTPPNSTVL